MALCAHKGPQAFTWFKLHHLPKSTARGSTVITLCTSKCVPACTPHSRFLSTHELGNQNLYNSHSWTHAYSEETLCKETYPHIYHSSSKMALRDTQMTLFLDHQCGRSNLPKQPWGLQLQMTGQDPQLGYGGMHRSQVLLTSIESGLDPILGNGLLRGIEDISHRPYGSYTLLVWENVPVGPNPHICDALLLYYMWAWLSDLVKVAEIIHGITVMMSYTVCRRPCDHQDFYQSDLTQKSTINSTSTQSERTVKPQNLVTCMYEPSMNLFITEGSM